MNRLENPNRPLEFNQWGNPAAAPKNDNPVNAKFIFNVLRRWWLPSFLCGLLLAVVAGIVPILMYKPKYHAETWLWIRQTHLVFPTEEDGRRFLETQQRMITSPPVLTDTLTRPEIASLPVFKDVEDKAIWLKQNLRARPEGQSDFFIISLDAEDPDSTHKIVNAVRDAYLATLRKQETKSTEDLLNLLNEERNTRSKVIESDRERLKTLAEENDGVGIVQDAVAPGDEKQVMQILSAARQLQEKLVDAEFEVVMERIKLQTATDSIKSEDITITDEDVRIGIESHPEVIELLAKLADEEKAMNTFPIVGSPQRRPHELTVQATKEDVEKKKVELTPLVKTEMLEAAKKAIEEGLDSANRNLSDKQKLVDALRAQLEDAKSKVREAGGASLAIQFLKEDLALRTEVYNKIVERIETIRTESRALSRVTTLHEASRPIRPDGSGPWKQVAVFAGGAFSIPFGLFFLLDLRRRQVTDSDDLSQATQLSIVGEVATLPVRSKLIPGTGKRFEQSLVRFEESIDYLRASIMQAYREQGIRSLVICSASAREGKSTVSAHLSSSIARSLKKVVLVDADMRRPHLHNLLDQSPDVGLGDLLSDNCSLDEAISKSWIDNLDFIAAGNVEHSVSDLLATDRFAEMLNSLYERYDFVVIDVPPIIPVSDGLVIARQADAAVFCALRDVSSATKISKACSMLHRAGVHLIGSIFNGAVGNRYSSDYEYYYYGGRKAGTGASSARV